MAFLDFLASVFNSAASSAMSYGAKTTKRYADTGVCGDKKLSDSQRELLREKSANFQSYADSLNEKRDQ